MQEATIMVESGPKRMRTQTGQEYLNGLKGKAGGFLISRPSRDKKEPRAAVHQKRPELTSKFGVEQGKKEAQIELDAINKKAAWLDKASGIVPKDWDDDQKINEALKGAREARADFGDEVKNVLLEHPQLGIALTLAYNQPLSDEQLEKLSIRVEARNALLREKGGSPDVTVESLRKFQTDKIRRISPPFRK